jgi:hypothetical protein
MTTISASRLLGRFPVRVNNRTVALSQLHSFQSAHIQRTYLGSLIDIIVPSSETLHRSWLAPADATHDLVQHTE